MVAEGGRPYVDFYDNKPPAFMLLVVLGGFTNFGTVMYGAVIIADIIIIFEVWNWTEELNIDRSRLIATTLTAAALTYMHLNYYVINNKALAVAIFLLAFRCNNPIKLGIGICISGLFAQPIVVAIPVILWYNLDNFREAVYFSIGGLFTAVCGYMIVVLLWDLQTGIAAVKQSFSVYSYVFATDAFADHPSIWREPIEWVRLTNAYQQTLVFPGIFSVYGFYRGVRPGNQHHMYVCMLAVVLLSLLLMRPWWHYAYFPLVPLAVLGGIGVEEFVPMSYNK
jgi:hypothetical protein